MRRNLLLSVCFLMASVLFAGPVTKQQAQEMAAQFLAGKSITHRAASASQMHIKVVMNAVDEAGQPYLYAVQPDNQRGFVIVSGDDRFRDFLGYSESGTFDNANMPDNMRAWLQGYVDEMKHLKAIGYQPSASAAHRASGVKKAISPLIQTHWNQDDPYNQKCPNFFEYGKSVTGCVATAMAQIMYYHKYPETVLADINGYNCARNWTNKGQIHVNGISAGTSLEWNKILPDYSGSYSNDQADAVATLMQVCGASVQMDYANSASGGSSASTSAVPNALITYFGYDESVRYESREMYTLATWTELIYGELAAARPVLYSGQSSGGGHAFVVDGYDGDELFHVNWGWGGSQDNYFALSVMNPGDKSGIGAGTSNDGYSYSQGAVIGIQIGSGETVEPTPVIIGIHSFTISGSSVLLSAFNWTGSSQTFDVGIGAVDAEGKITVIKTLKSNWALNANSGQYNMECAFEKDGTKANQVLKVVPISKLSSKDKWATDFNYDKRYIEVAYDAEGNPTLTSYPLDPHLSVTSFSFTGSKYKDEEQPVAVTLSNTGGEFYGVLYLFASTDSNNKGTYVNKGGVTVLKDKTASLTFEWTPATSGTYHVWVATDEAGSNVVGQTTVSIDINAHVPTGPFIILALSVTDADETSWTTDGDGNILVDVYSKTIEVAPTIKNISSTNYGSLNVDFYLQKWNGSSWVDLSNVYANGLSMQAGKTKPFSEIVYGNSYDYGKYRIVLKVNGNEYDTRYTLNLTMGYNTTNANGNLVRVKTASSDVTVASDAVAVDLSEFNYTAITPNSNPNTLYIIGGSQTAPTSLNGRNVVKGGTIGTLNLTDGYAFSTPVDFHANNVTYTRTINSYYSAGAGWTTLVLPFEATVSNSDGNLTWYDPDRRFWLMEFSGDAGSSVNFSHATGTTIKANTPYIIALPGDAYGEYSLVGKNTLTFTATNVDFTANAKASTTGTNYKFVGTTTNTDNKVMYKLNAAGNSFKKDTVTESPFRAYFEGTSTAATATSLGISFGGNTTGIAEIDTLRKVEDNKFYNLNGQRVSQPKKGLYIVNGKKVVIK